MKTKTNTHALTQEEYDLFFSDDITIRRKKELAKKIENRLRHFEKVFVDSQGFDEIDADYIFRYYTKQKPREIFNVDDFAPYYYLNGDYKGIIVRFLWEDQAVDEAVKKVEEWRSAEEKADSEYTGMKKAVLDKIRSVVTEEEKWFLKNDIGFLQSL